MAQRMIDETVARRFIQVACGMAVFSGLATVAASFLGIFDITLFSLIDAAFVFGLAYGVYKRSRTCAIILFVYYIENQLDVYQRTGDLNAAFGFLLGGCAVAYFLGILGTFAVHAIENEKKPQAA